MSSRVRWMPGAAAGPPAGVAAFLGFDGAGSGTAEFMIYDFGFASQSRDTNFANWREFRTGRQGENPICSIPLSLRSLRSFAVKFSGENAVRLDSILGGTENGMRFRFI